MKVKNISGKVKNFKLGSEWISVEPEEVIEVANNVIQAEDGLIEVKSRKKKSAVKKEIYTKTDLMDMTKTQQEKILKGFKLSIIKIKLLATEKNRVNKILKLQK